MTKMDFAQLLEDKCPRKPLTVPCSSELFRRAIFLLVVSVGMFANVAQAQFVGITKPFDPSSLQLGSGPSNFQLGPIGETVVTGNGIEYHGGPVMEGPHNVYFIWYGNFSGNPALSILPDLIHGFGGSQYFNTNTTYGDATGDVGNTVTMAGQTFDNYSQGTALNNTNLPNVISAPLNSGKLPVDPNGIYFVLTSPDVTETGFCTTFCGFHTFGTFGATTIKVAFVGDAATQCPARPGQLGCSAQSLTHNGNEGADAMANVMAHELNETVTDPELNAWFHIDGSGEVGDICASDFGTTFTALNKARANVVLSGRQYLLQSNFLN